MRGPELPTDDLYARLELPVDAAPEAIEIAWRSLLKRHHPDVAGESSLETAKRINIAHDWLADPALRARYDRTLLKPAATRAGSTRAAASRAGSSRDPAAARDPAPGGPRPSRPGEPHHGSHRHVLDPDERAPDLDLRSPVVAAFLEQVAALGPDEIDRLALAERPPLAFVASIRRFLVPERSSALDALEGLVAERLPTAARSVPAVRDAATSFGQYLLLAGFLADTLSEPFRERVEERMTRGWLAAMRVPRYGPRTSEVRALTARARTLSAAQGAFLVEAAARLGLTDRLWPHGTDPDEDEVLRVSAALAARDASAAAAASGADRRVQGAVASFARVAALAPAFGPAEAGRLLRPWRDLDIGPQPAPGRPRRVDR